MLNNIHCRGKCLGVHVLLFRGLIVICQQRDAPVNKSLANVKGTFDCQSQYDEVADRFPGQVCDGWSEIEDEVVIDGMGYSMGKTDSHFGWHKSCVHE